MVQRIRPARHEDLPDLTAICLRSKAHWGYDAAFMEACRDELTLRPEDLLQGQLMLCEEAEQPLAVAQMMPQGEVAELVKLFVRPEAIGRGVGRELLVWAIGAAREAGAARLECDADPFAEGFYQQAGFRCVGEVPSGTWPGRMLPRMVLML